MKDRTVPSIPKSGSATKTRSGASVGSSAWASSDCEPSTSPMAAATHRLLGRTSHLATNDFVALDRDRAKPTGSEGDDSLVRGGARVEDDVAAHLVRGA